MRKSTFLALAAVAAIVVPHMAYGAGVNAGTATGAVAAPLDRAALVTEIVSTWRSEISARGIDVGPWENDMRQALATRSDAQLLSLVKAGSYDALARQIGASPAPETASASGAIGSQSSLTSARTPLVVGDAAKDLVYVPITPCRVFDTRFGSGAGKINAGATKAFLTNSVANPGPFAAQGGDASGCPAIPFDPPGVMLTVTAVDEEATGFLTVWPLLATIPNASHLNWTTNIAIANTTAVATCVVCGFDINVAVSARTNVIGDVVGYFEQAVLPPAGRAYAVVNKGASPSFVTARTKNFSAVSQPSLGVYCLSTAVDVTNTPILVTVEWGASSGNSLVAFVQTNSPAFACTTGQVEVRTYDFTGALSNSVAFNVLIP